MKDDRITIRVTPAEKKRLTKAADKAGLTLSHWLRLRLSRWMKP
jgi:uncharacterized protein (DUF1778 family)